MTDNNMGIPNEPWKHIADDWHNGMRVKGRFVRTENGIKFMKDDTGDWYVYESKWALGVDPYKVQSRFKSIINWFKKRFK
jgi:hypothetical protein